MSSITAPKSTIPSVRPKNVDAEKLSKAAAKATAEDVATIMTLFGPGSFMTANENARNLALVTSHNVETVNQMEEVRFADLTTSQSGYGDTTVGLVRRIVALCLNADAGDYKAMDTLERLDELVTNKMPHELHLFISGC